MARRMWRPPVVLALMTALVAPAVAADPPDAATLAAKMKTALEPPKSSLRQMKLSISGDAGGTTQWTVAQARKTIDGQGRILNVLLAPADDRGIASLQIEGAGGNAPVTALYVPTIRRVRTLTPAGAYEAVLGSDFTYADLGFVNLKDRYSVLGTEKKQGKDAYKLEQVIGNPFYYSKIVSWIDPANLLPLERDYYDPAGRLWKVETFDDVVDVDGQPVATKVTMKDVQTQTTSVIDVSKLRFGVELPETLFEKDDLPQVSTAPIWSGLQ